MSGALHPPAAAITGRPIRFALVGCGRIASIHVAALREHAAQAQWVAVCDTDPAALARACEETGGRGFRSLAELLAARLADVVVLATPSGLHPHQAVQCAQAGVHVVTEKPMATRWADGLRMVRACDEAGVYLFVVKQNRRNATLQCLHEAITRGRFGRLYLLALNVFWQRPQAGYYDQAAWRGTWELDGGAFMNQASHYVDLLQWLGGPIDSVHAYAATLARDIATEDTGVLTCRWRHGGLGSLNVTMLAYPRNLEGSITVLGETGSARVGGVAVNHIEHWEFARPEPQDEAIRAVNYETHSVYGFGHAQYYANVIEVLQGRARAQVDGREGLKSLEVLVAACRSARDGVRVQLPLEL